MKKTILGLLGDVFLIVTGAVIAMFIFEPKHGGPIKRHIWSAIGQKKFVDFYTTNDTYVTVVWTTNLTTNGYVYYGTVVTNKWK